MQYNVQDPLITIYKEIEELEQLGKAANNPYLPSQLVTFALQIIKNTGDFEDSQKKWHIKTPIDKTWNNFKIHFDTEHQALRKVRGITMRSTAFHSAAMASEIIEEIKGVKESVNIVLRAREEDQENTPPVHHANFTRQDDQQSDILNFLKKLQDEVSALKISNNNRNNNTRKRKRTDKYCWTHGACAHESKDCKPSYRKPGHVESATFADKQGGSTKYCTLCNE